MTIAELNKLSVGTVLQKGKRKRIFLGIDGVFVHYKTPSSSKEKTSEHMALFANWLKGANVVTE